jgi:hypothetical protein
VLCIFSFLFRASDQRFEARISLLTPSIPINSSSIIPSAFGVEMRSITNLDSWGQRALANAYFIQKNGLKWSDVEPVEGQPYNWSGDPNLELELNNASTRGMQTILVVGGVPNWAQTSYGKACGPINPDKFVAFANFMKAAVARYRVAPFRVKYWEICNEPDIDPSLVDTDSVVGCWGNANDDFYGGGAYAAMLKEVYPAIKASDPNAQVMVGGLLLDCDLNRVCPPPKSLKFLEGILRYDNGKGGDYFDGVSFHAYDYYYGVLGQYMNTYWNSYWNTTGPVQLVKVNFIRGVLGNYGYQSKFLINTGLALLCISLCDDTFEQTKAYYLAEGYSSGMAFNFQPDVWYAAKTGWRNSNLLDADLSPTLAYNAFKFGQSELVNSYFNRQINTDPGVKIFEYMKTNRRVWLLWSLDGSTHAVHIPLPAKAAFDLSGNPLSVVKDIAVGLMPTYIEMPIGYTVQLPIIASGLQPIANGDFEQGIDRSGNPIGWIAYKGGGDGLAYSLVNQSPSFGGQIDPNIPMGSYSMLLGSTEYTCEYDERNPDKFPGVPIGYAAVAQTVKVPNVPDNTPLNLIFAYIIYTQDLSTLPQPDRFEVHITEGTSDNLAYQDSNLTNPAACPPSPPTRIPRIDQGAWKLGFVNLVSPIDYRGKTITISFQNWNRPDRWYNTVTYLDYVQINTGSLN